MRVVVAYWGLAGCLACGSTTRNPAHEAGGGSPGVGGSATAGTAAGGVAGGEPADALQVPPAPMRRLTSFEYQATVKDILGISGVALPQDGERGGFDNNADLQAVDVALLQEALATAENVSRALFSDETLRARLPPCADSSCVSDFVRQVSRSLFRRPASEAELAPYLGVYEAASARGVTHDTALEHVLASLLISSQFLFRMEFSRGGAAAEEPLDSYAMATRLSYLLWSSAPDDALLAAAAADELQDDAGLAAAFERLLADPRSRRFAENFAGQWLGLRSVETYPAKEHFPKWSPALASELAQEGYRYFAGFLQGDEPWTTFLRAPIPTPRTERVAAFLPDREPRLGFLSLPGWLAVTSFGHRTSPSHRGTVLRRQLLCQPPPEPPADEPTFEQGPWNGVRDALNVINADPRCADCHLLIDPLGVALERYDSVGQYRTHYEDGLPVDTVAQVPPGEAYPNGLSLTGLNDVSEYLATNPAFMTCLIEKLYTYGMGRVPKEGEDAGNPALLAEQWQEGTPSLRAALATLVQSKPFRLRSSGGAP